MHPRRLPPLDLVRGFVAVGRRLSITQAANDLNLTQSAISKQVRALEETLQVRLLKRGYRSIEFTTEGARLFRVAEAAIGEIDKVASEIAPATQRVPVIITASVGVSSLWILPKLSQFRTDHPSIDVKLVTDNKFLDLEAEGVDLAIRCCSENESTPNFTHLFPETVVPVAHPSLQLPKLDVEVIESNILIEFDDPQRRWLRWSERLQMLGFGGIKPRGILLLDQYNQVIEAAAAGYGIALGRLSIIETFLAQNLLVTVPYTKNVPEDQHAYWLVTASNRHRDEVAIVSSWIQRRAEQIQQHAFHYQSALA